MGLAASQARYLYLTARQTTVEFEGQQVNQARSALANETAGLFNQMLGIQSPTAPTMYGIQEVCNSKTAPDPTNTTKYPNGANDIGYKEDLSAWTSYQSDQNLQNAYSAAMDVYDSENQKYQQAIDQINAKTAQIQQQDKSLELQLRQLDTEQQTIVTELDSVKKVIDKNIDTIFKTFQ